MISTCKLELGRQPWRTWSIMLAAPWLLVAAAAQAAQCSAQPQLAPGTTLAGARISTRPSPFAGMAPLPMPPLSPMPPITPNRLPAPPRMPEFAGFLPWMSPSAVAVRNNYVYVVDAGRRQIFLLDQAQQTMTPFGGYAAGAVSSITVGPDMSLYVADINARKVLHFSIDGRLLQTFANDLEMARPVAVLLDEASGNVLVADSLYNHVVVFNSLGRVLSVLRSEESRSTEAMARGPDGLYLVDRLSKQVVVIGMDGAERYLLGQGSLKNPGAIAVDQFNRVFVSDSFDNTIKIYEQGQLAATVGGSGATPASFNRITGLWLDRNVLYVVDSLNARIQTFLVAPPCVKG